MSFDMLGKIMSELVRLPSEALGIVYDFVVKVKDPEWQEAAKKFLRKEEVVPVPTFPQYPADGVEFELKFDFDAPEADPIQMVRADGYSSLENWKFMGQKLSGVQTRTFKLVRVGACRNLDEVREKLAVHGEVPAGQWREAFKAAYTKSDGQGPIGFADPSWVDPYGYVHFPCVRSDGVSRFDLAGVGHDESGRWLVPASK